ncbi:MAG: ribbon-helix-helix domain-containing protein [Nitrospiraceae bacterium]|nr:MAG: ribbon-helix-helix domain-containing protein [Nitrospiraceae bacterium]
MQSQMTVRLPEDLDKEITNLSRKLRLKRSYIVRMALEKFLEDFNVKEETVPYERVKDLIGSISSGIPDLGESHRKHLLKKLNKNA